MSIIIKGYISGVPFFEKGSFKMYGFYPNDSCLDKISLSNYGNITIKGELPTLVEGKEYEIEVEYEKKGKYESYVVKRFINNPMDMNENEAFNFLSELVGDNLADNILKVYPNFVKMIIANKKDEIDVNKIHGVGEITLNKIADKISKNIMFYNIISEYKEYELTLNQIQKIYDTYNSFDLLKEKMNENPYQCLCSIGGISFKTADVKILNKNKGLVKSKYRMTESIIHVLEQNEKNGHTWIKTNELYSECSKISPQCMQEFKNVLEQNDRIYFDKENKKISKKQTYCCEKEIAERLFNISKDPRVYEMDSTKFNSVDNFTLTQEQKVSMNYANKFNFFVLAGNAGCVDCDTEYFNGVEWKKISEYKEGEKVLQYNKDKSAELVLPLKYHKYISEYLWHFKTKYGLDQCLCDDHNVYYITSKNNLYHKTFREVRDNHEKTGFLGKFITTFDYEGKGLPYNEWEIRLKVAIKADGSFKNKYKPFDCYINIKEKRKKERLEWLLNNNNIKYEILDGAEGYSVYKFTYLDNEKTYTKEWYNCTKEQYKIIYDEIFYWDGDFKYKDRFFTTIKSDADFIQFVGTSLGYRCSIQIKDRTGQINKIKSNNKSYIRKSIDYVVNFTKRTLISLCSDSREDHTKTPITKYKTLDGYKYCFTVPSGMLVLRRNNCIFITGNCGKTASTKALLDMLDEYNYSYVLYAPTGKASKNFYQNTNRHASTIHRGLGFNPVQGFFYNETNKLPYDYIIVDEATMIDIYLMRSLLRAIDENRSKLIFICDPAQIPSVGCGNCIQDIINSNMFPVIFLDKVFRYKDGGLAKIATDTRNGEMFIFEEGVQKFGDDFIFVPTSKDTLIDKIISAYNKMLDKGGTIDDIVVLSAYNVGEHGTYKINSIIQNLINPSNGEMELSYVRQKFEIKFRINDRVMQVVNNYQAPLFKHEDQLKKDEEYTAIFNGDDGKIIKIGTNHKGVKYMVVDFNGELVLYRDDDIRDLLLAYSISGHKSQGSGYKYVIAVTPPTHKFFLNRNLLYVMYTRTKKFIYNIGTIDTIESALKKSENLNRQTHLKDLLILKVS